MRGWGFGSLSLCLAGAAVLVLSGPAARAEPGLALGERARDYLVELIRIDTTNPPGNETRAATFLKSVADRWEIPAEVLGGDPARLNFVARLRGSSNEKPLLLMAHSDVVPAEPSQWSAGPFSGILRGGEIYGRGAVDDKSLLAAELAVLVELKRQEVRLERDVILLAEADEESDSSGVRWILENAYEKIDAEFAFNEGGFVQALPSGVRLFQVQTSEKIPTRIRLTARGVSGHASLPRSDNALVRLSRALVRLADFDQPVRLNPTTHTYFSGLSKLPDFRWLTPLVRRLENPSQAVTAASLIRSRDPELDAQLRTSVSPTILTAGVKVNVIPSTATAEVDVRRLPDETREEVLLRLRRIVDDSAVEVSAADRVEMPATPPSSLTTAAYRAMERVFSAAAPRSVILPYMARGATDGSFLRQKGMAVYGVPIFLKAPGESLAHGNDERIPAANLEAGAGLLWKLVLHVAAGHEF